MSSSRCGCPSGCTSVAPEPRQARSDAVPESVECCPGKAVFDANRRAVLGPLGFDPEAPAVCGGQVEVRKAIADRHLRAPARPADAALMDVVAVLIGETLAAGSPGVDEAGIGLGVAMARR